ncbi:outer membrane protein assembly factor BamB family protein, partial [Geoglobus sp.]
LWNFTALHSASAWESIASSPAVADGVVYFATNTANGTVFALNATTGQLIWSHGTDNYIMSSPFVDNGKLYIGADDGNLYILGLWRGSLTIEPGSFTVKDDSGNTYTVSNFTVLGVLQKLREVAGINYTVYLSPYDNESLFLSSLAGIGSSSGWWMTEVNGQGISRGMQFENVSDGDVVTFWLYPVGASWGSVSAENAPYLVEVAVKGKLADINGLQAGNGVRGGYISSVVNLTSYYIGWITVVVSGTNSNGDSIVGISTVRVEHGQTVVVPVMLAIPQQAQTGTYSLYVGVYRLGEFPNEIKTYTTAPVSVTVS